MSFDFFDLKKDHIGPWNNERETLVVRYCDCNSKCPICYAAGPSYLHRLKNEKITIYDATYLYLAIENKAILVTDDSKLKEKAAKYVEVMNSNQLETRILKGK